MTIEKFDLFRKRRNISDYERADMISDIEADEMIALAMSLPRGLIAWIRKYHPSLKA